MKFKKYLIEKINKKEFADVLKNNKNVKAGCEFEFYLDENNFSSSSLDENVVRKLERDSDIDIDNINKNINNYYQAINDYYKEEIETEDKITDLENEISELEDKITDAEVDMMGEEDTTKWDKIIDEFNKDNDDLQTELSDLEDRLKWIQDGDMQDETWNEYEPAPSVEDIRDFFNLVDLFNENGYYIEGERDEHYNQKLFNMFEEDQEIPYTNPLFNEFYGFYMQDLIIEGNGQQQVPDADYLENELNFPVNIGYGWEVKEDGSLNDGGMEISTGIENLEDLIDIIEDVFKWIDDVGYTDGSTGFHVHMSLNNHQEIDPLKLLLFVEEGLVFKHFEDRALNSYAISIQKGHFDKMEPFTNKDVINLAKKEKIEKNVNTDKYMGVHLIELENNHVEFRYLGGKDYHKKFKEIRDIIINYAYWLSIACDPDYKRKEYLLKVNRLTNKYNALYLHNLMSFYWNQFEVEKNPHGMDEKKFRKLAQQHIKPFQLKFKSLPKLKTYYIGNTKFENSASEAGGKEWKLFKKKMGIK